MRWPNEGPVVLSGKVDLAIGRPAGAESRKVIAEAVGESAEDLDTAFEGVHYWGRAENESGFAEYVSTTLPMVLQSARDAGVITADVDPATAATDQFLK